MSSNPSNYFKNKGKGRMYVRPQYHTKWIPYDEWMTAALFERFEEKVKCGTYRKENASRSTFCYNCGELIK